MTYAALDRESPARTRSEIEARLDELARTPAFLRASVRRAAPERLLRRPGPEPAAFSIHEQIWHLRDIDVLGYARRVRALIAEEHPTLPDIDGTRLAIERNYLGLALEPALTELERARAETLAHLRAQAHATFSRRGEMEGVGCVTLAQLVEMWCDHDRVHRREIEELLA